MAAIGRVLLIPKGTYDSSATYNMLDWVRYNGKAWVCKVDGTINVTPTEGANWTLMAQDGSGGGGGASDWDDINYKPFDTIDTTNDFSVDSGDNNKLHIKRDTFGTVRVISDNSGTPTTTDLEASGDATITLQGGTNVTLAADDSSNPKKITINSSGGGGGSSTFAGLDDVSLSGTPTVGQIVQYTQVGADVKLRNVAMPTGGHTMIPTTNDIATIEALANGNDDYVVNAYTVKRWSDVSCITLVSTAEQGDDGLGTWEDNWESSTDRTGWILHDALLDILSDDEVEIEPVFDIGGKEVVSLYAYRIDDHYNNSGSYTGAIAFKFNGEIQNASGVKVGVKIKRQRSAVIDLTPTP